MSGAGGAGSGRVPDDSWPATRAVHDPCLASQRACTRADQNGVMLCCVVDLGKPVCQLREKTSISSWPLQLGSLDQSVALGRHSGGTTNADFTPRTVCSCHLVVGCQKSIT